jgi:integrase
MGQSRKRIGGDGKARYTAYYEDVTGRRRSAGTYGSRRDADRAWQRAEADSAKGRHTDSGRSRQQFARYVEDEWFPNHQIELTTRQNYRYVLDKHILPVFGGYKMIAILPADIRAWVASLKDAGVKPATVKHCLAVLSAIFTTAFNDQITTLNPCAGIKAPPVPPATRRIITPEQFAAIHAALPTPELRLLVETDVETGLRWGELVELRVGDLDLQHGLLAVSRTVIEIPAKFHPTGDRFLIKNYPKDKQPRRLGLSHHIHDLLTNHVQGMGPSDLVFPAPPTAAKRNDKTGSFVAQEFGLTEPNPAGHTYRHGTLTGYSSGGCRCPHCRAAYATYRSTRRASGADPARATRGPRSSDAEADRHISRTWFRRQIWEPALKEAGLPFHVRVHDLRHAHASWLLSGGADLQAVKDRMGHARLTTTEQYLHTLPHADAATITALDNIRNRNG